MSGSSSDRPRLAPIDRATQAADRTPSKRSRNKDAVLCRDEAGRRRSGRRVLVVLCSRRSPSLARVAIAIESPGPVFYRATRVGRNGRHAARAQVPQDARRRDGQCADAATTILVSRASVASLRGRSSTSSRSSGTSSRGEMSLVGPRPEDADFVALHADEYQEILSVRPGVTGLCQLAFAQEAEILDADDRRRALRRSHPAAEGCTRPLLRARGRFAATCAFWSGRSCR